MRKLQFKYAKAENFLCFGPPVEINFLDHGNIVLVRGENLDVAGDPLQDAEQVRVASNGVGKSSLPEILVYTLYGKTIKKPKKISHADVINKSAGKKLRTEVVWDKYRAVRTRKPDSLRLWESEDGVWDDDTEITLGGMPATQKLIEEKIGLSYEAFVNIVVFTDDNNAAFLECDGPEKRAIVENLLSLEKYRAYSDNARSLFKEAKDKIKLLSKEYELLLHDRDSCEARVEKLLQQEKDWKAARMNELRLLVAQAKQKKEELAKSDHGAALLAWQEAQGRLAELNEEITGLEEKQKKVSAAVDKAKEKYHELLAQEGELAAYQRQHLENAKRSKAEAAALEESVRSLSKKKGSKCPACYGVVEEKNYSHVVEHARAEAQKHQAAAAEEEASAKKMEQKAKQVREFVATVRSKIAEAEGKLETHQDRLREARQEVVRCSKVREPKADSAELLLEQQVSELKKQAAAKKAELEGPSPYAEIVKSAQDDVADRSLRAAGKEAEIKADESDLPYYEYWIRAFGDNGIRKFVIDGIVPAMNARIAYWLQFLIDNKIDLTFDNQFEENIRRFPADESPFIYHVLSNGQRRRLNLAVSQAFAYVMMLNCGASPSVVFLDEVTTNIDPIGVQGIYNMICELAKEKQVFVTTHDHDLLGMLHGCDTINLRMKGGTTTLVRPAK